MAKKAVITGQSDSANDTKENLAKVLQESLNKKFKDYNKVAYFLGDDTSPSDLTDWIPTGCSTLDLAISNRPNGGWPCGRLIEINGLEAAGKSLLAAHALANTQKMGGLAVFIDTENAVSHEFLQAIGVDTEKLLYIQLETVEDIYETIENIAIKVKETNKERYVTIVVDSMAGATTKVEQESNFDKDGWATAKAIINSKALRKITQLIGRQKICLIFTNQLRQRLGISFGDAMTSSGGYALGFHASVRIRLKATGKIKEKINGVEQITGIETSAEVFKNRCGPPKKKATFKIYFDRGIDDTDCWFDVLKEFKILSSAGAWYTYVSEKNGEEIKFQLKDFEKKLLSDPELKQELYDKICSLLIMKYKKAGELAERGEITLESPDETDDVQEMED